ncbi:uncharacterized protein [Aegilops tauschii subsp. strangulata]|uniref:uncharacterized protein n=1 Tax=Aegilops tauschii subsp. strangulata TaxID=200361 RepID=UPI001E1CA2F3|nr:uncharacterized protein LOC120975836 [Aegilops tauschii subsp. strangulata]
MEFTDGPNTELGGVAIQKRKDVDFPHEKHASHPKDWNHTWFYCKDTSPEGKNPLPGYRAHRLPNTHPFPQRMTAKERSQYAPQLSKLRAFMANGLTGNDFVRCWLSWSILPLSRRSGLMCEYTGAVTDLLRHTDVQLSEAEITEAVKKMLDEPVEDCSKTGLSPFYALNKLPGGDDPFWKKKPEDKAPKPSRVGRPKHKVTKQAGKKKTADSADADDALDNQESEGEGDVSRAGDVEVIILSSGSESLPTQKARRVIRKVRFSHPLAHLDKNFLLKKQQVEARRQTRHSGQKVTSSGLPNTPVTSHSSSGESTGTQVPVLKTVPGAQARARKRAKPNSPAVEPKLLNRRNTRRLILRPTRLSWMTRHLKAMTPMWSRWRLIRQVLLPTRRALLLNRLLLTRQAPPSLLMIRLTMS